MHFRIDPWENSCGSMSKDVALLQHDLRLVQVLRREPLTDLHQHRVADPVAVLEIADLPPETVRHHLELRRGPIAPFPPFLVLHFLHAVTAFRTRPRSGFCSITSR